MSESRGGESRTSYPSYSYTPHRSYEEPKSPRYQASVEESREDEESEYCGHTPQTPKNVGENSIDIGDIRSQVMQELYAELYGEIKEEVRQELLKEKPEIVREVKDELKEKLKADLKRSFTQGRGEER